MKTIISILSFFLISTFSYAQDLNEKLFHAIEKGNPEEVKKLVEQGADMNAKNNFGETPCDYAQTEELEKLLCK